MKWSEVKWSKMKWSKSHSTFFMMNLKKFLILMCVHMVTVQRDFMRIRKQGGPSGCGGAVVPSLCPTKGGEGVV